MISKVEWSHDSYVTSAKQNAKAPATESYDFFPDPLYGLHLDVSPVASQAQISPVLARPAVHSGTSDRHLVLDRSLKTAVGHMVDFLCQPLTPFYPQKVAMLSDMLAGRLEALYRPSWDETEPSRGQGGRSLICDHDGLPRVMLEVSARSKLDSHVWKDALRVEDKMDGGVIVKDVWQMWCDPGCVSIRYGPWEWEDQGFEPFKVFKESIHVIWQASHTPPLNTSDPIATPLRPSYAIPIRAPHLNTIPPTPAPRDSISRLEDPPTLQSLSLLPSAPISHSRYPSSDTGRSHSPALSDLSPSSEFFPVKNHARARTYPEDRSRGGNRSVSGTSTSSSISDSHSVNPYLLTPVARPASAEPYIVSVISGQLNDEDQDDNSTPTCVSRGRDPSPRSGETPASAASTTPGLPTPTVTPYDGGNVTVLGGGVKLGGTMISRPSSVLSHGGPIDRSRSPSISFASRALNTVLGPNGIGGCGSPRKVRTRRRIVPTYLGHLGQPGVGGPVLGPFGQFAGKIQPGQPQMGGWVPSIGMGGTPMPFVPGTSGLTPRLGSKYGTWKGSQEFTLSSFF